GQGTRIGLQGNLCAVFQGKPVPYSVQKTDDPFTVDDRRRAAADEHRGDRSSGRDLAPGQFQKQRFTVTVLLLYAGSSRQEITVAALFYTKGNMQIEFHAVFHIASLHDERDETTPLSHPAIFSSYLSSSFNTLIKAFCGISTLPT